MKKAILVVVFSMVCHLAWANAPQAPSAPSAPGENILKNPISTQDLLKLQEMQRYGLAHPPSAQDLVRLKQLEVLIKQKEAQWKNAPPSAQEKQDFYRRIQAQMFQKNSD